jgi:hypothetical protein
VAELWAYTHADLDEPRLPDGTIVRRPVATIAIPGSRQALLAVVDSGSPLTVADALLFPRLGIDLDNDEPVFSVPLTIGRNTNAMPVYEVELVSLPPEASSAAPITWRLQLGARPNWHLPFTVLFGRRGWFDRFPTTIDGHSCSVDVASERAASGTFRRR